MKQNTVETAGNEVGVAIAGKKAIPGKVPLTRRGRNYFAARLLLVHRMPIDPGQQSIDGSKRLAMMHPSNISSTTA